MIRSLPIRLRLICLAIFYLATIPGRAEMGPDGFAQGNTFYGAGKFTEAAAAYEGVAHSGTYSASLFYNLGNTYDRLGQRGRSVLNYQRALLLEPTHSEARANLAFVQGSRSGGQAGGSWLATQTGVLDADLWPVVAAALGGIGLVCLAFARPPYRRYLLGAAICLALALLAAGRVWQLDDGSKNPGRAVVLTDGSRALYAPADNSKVITKLAAGSEVRVLSEQGVWVYAQLPDGSRAWLAAAQVEKVLPSRKS